MVTPRDKELNAPVGLALSTVPCSRWPLAGMKLTPPLRDRLGLDRYTDSPTVEIEGLDHSYLLKRDYLIPYYAVSSVDVIGHADMAHRNEDLIIDRARSFIFNAQPGLSIPRTPEQIASSLAGLRAMPEDTHWQCGLKAAEFKAVAGAIVTRFETLGRAIFQRNPDGTMMRDKEIAVEKGFDEDFIRKLREEYRHYYALLMKPPLDGFMHLLQLTDRRVDTDGILIDLLREIGKPLRVTETNQENSIRDLMLLKMGDAAQAIDQVHALLVETIETEPTRSLLRRTVRDYVRQQGTLYGLAELEDILPLLDHYTMLCRARACMKRDDPAYDEVFRVREVLVGLFTGEKGIFQSRNLTRAAGSEDARDLLDSIRDAILLMDRTANTRIPCNKNAPQPWIPNTDPDAKPMEKYLVDEFLRPAERAYAIAMRAHAASLPPEESDPFLRKAFCSLSLLKVEIEQVKTHLTDTKARR